MSLIRTLIAAISILTLTSQSVAAVSYPSSGPSGTYSGGSFGTYLKNIITNPCPTGEVVSGFSTGAGNYGEPICTSMSITSGGTAGDTLRYDGSTWAANSIIYNDGTNVGIGNSLPASKLDVRGVLTVNPNSYGDAIDLYNGNKIRTVGGGGIQLQGSPYVAIGNVSGLNGATFSVGNTGASVLTLYPDVGQYGLEISGYNFAVDNEGSLGIGTITPSAKLEISSTKDNAFRINKNGGTNWSYMEWLYGGVRKYWQGLNSAGYYALESDTSTGRIYLSGSMISIGVANPGYRLDVAPGFVNSASGYCIGGSCIQNWSNIRSYMTGNPGYLASYDQFGTLGNASSYQSGSRLFVGDVAYILSGSMTSPGYLSIYSVSGSSSANPMITMGQPGYPDCKIWVNGASVLESNCSIGMFNTSLSIDPNQIIRADAYGTGLAGSVIYESGGNIGIGTTTPSAKLEIVGQIKITGGSPGAGKVLTSDAGGLASWQTLGSSFTGVSSFNSRTGIVIGASGDYTAGQVTNISNISNGGNIASTNVQNAINELDTEKQQTITGAATSVILTNLTPNAALVSDVSGKIGASASISNTELGYLDNVSSNIQNQLDAKEATISTGTTGQYFRGDKSWQTLNTNAVTEASNLYYSNARVWASLSGAISPYLTGNLTTNRALASDVSGKLSVANTTLTELNYVNGVTSSIQSQLNSLSTNKADLVSPALSGTPTAPTASSGANTTQIATTAFVNNAITNGISAGALAGNFWYLSGNSIGVNDYIGTNNARDLVFKTNNTERLRIFANGNIGGLNYYSGSMSSGSNKLVIGENAGLGMAGTGNMALGGNNAGAAMAGNNNVALGGNNAGASMIGDSNVAVGGFNAGANMTGNNSTALGGFNAGQNMSANYSVALGGIGAGTSMSQDYSVAIGSYAGSGMTSIASNNIYIGTNAIGNVSQSNQFSIGNVIYGSGMGQNGLTSGMVGIGTMTPSAKFQVVGSTRFDLGSDATGDMFYRSAGGNLSRLALGSAGKILTSSGGVPSWVDAATLAAPVDSVFGRTGNVIGASGDYTAGKITNVAAGNIAATNVQAALNELDTEKEPSLTAGLSTQYYRGDKTWQTLNTAAVTESTNLYFTNARVASALTGAISPILTTNLTATSAVVTDSNGKITTLTGLSTTELGYVDGVTNAIQTQLNTLSTNKADLTSPALAGTPTAPTASIGTNTTQIATTAFVNTAITNGTSAASLAGSFWTLSGSAAGANDFIGTTNSQNLRFRTNNTQNMVLDTSGNLGIGIASPGSYRLYANGDAYVSGSLSILGNLFVDSIINRSVTNLTISGNLLPDANAPLNFRNLGSNTQRWNNLYLSGQITIGGGTPGAGKVLMSDSNGLATWQNVTGFVSSVFGRTGSVASASGDYTAGQITNIAAGNIAATNLQAAINELDTEKANLASPALTGIPTAPTASSGTNDTQIATTAFVKSQAYLTGYTETDPQVGANTTNYLSKWNGSSLISSSVFENGTGVGIGTASPNYLLDVAGTGNFIGVRIPSGASNGYILTSDATGNARWAINAAGCTPGGTGAQNTCAGVSALQINSAGSYNAAFGESAMQNNTLGNINAAFGHQAMMNNTTGDYNTAVGAGAMKKNITGVDNTAIGANALGDNTYGSENVAIGDTALRQFKSGGSNTAVGQSSLWNLQAGSYNISLGRSNEVYNGTGNIIIGNSIVMPDGSENQLSIGNWIYGNNGNIGIGTSTGLTTDKLVVAGTGSFQGLKILSGASNGFVLTSDASGNARWSAPTGGNSWSLSGNAIGGSDFIGSTNGQDVIFKANNNEGFRLTANGNILGLGNAAIGGLTSSLALGKNAGFSMSGTYNSAIGGYLAGLLMSGSYNSAIGGERAGNSMVGTYNSAFGGYYVGDSMTGTYNSAFGGRRSGTFMNGTYNSAFGGSSAGYSMSGTFNTAVGGQNAGFTMLGSYNVVVGGVNLGGLMNGSNSVLVGGNNAGQNMNGSYNATLGGFNAGYYMSGTYNVAIGTYAGSGMATGDNNIYIGSYAFGNANQSNQFSLGNVIYGSGMGTGGLSNGMVGIGTMTPGAKLEVAGQIKITGGSPGAGKVLTSDAAGLATWQSLSGASVASVFGRSGAVVSASGDYTAGQVTNVAAGNIAATNVQAALNELDTEKEPTITAGTAAQYYRGDKTWQTLDKTAVGLGNVDNTSDVNKPVSTAQQTALNLKADLASPALTGTPTAPTASSGTNTTQIATTAFVKSQNYLTGYTETDPEVGANTTNFLSKWNGSSLVTSSIFDNGNVGIGTATPGAYKLNVNGDTYISGALSILGKLYVDTIVNRTVTNVTVSGGLIPDSAAPLAVRELGTNATRWNNLYLSGQITIGGGSPGAGKYLTSDANGLASWTTLTIPADVVTSVFGRTGTVIGSSGDYTAGQITNVAAGNISSTNLQAAINELDNEKQITITGAASSVTLQNLATDFALVSSSTGKIATSSTISSTELGYLDNATSNIQAQLNNRWTLSGNSIGANDFIGTTNNQDIILKSNNIEKARIFASSTNNAILSLTGGGISITGSAIVIGDTTGNTRPKQSIDMQFARTSATQIANGTGAIVIGGYNSATSVYPGATNIGYANTYTGGLSDEEGAIVLGSYNNVASSYGPTVVLGMANSSNAEVATTILGSYNSVPGSSNIVTSVGYQNLVTYHLGQVFGYNNSAGESSVVVGINNKMAETTYSTADYNIALGIGNNNTNDTSPQITNTVLIGLNNTGAAVGAYVFGSGITNNIEGSVQIGTNNATKLTLVASGALGIGTTTPTSKLDVAGTGTFQGLKILSGASNGFVLTSDASGNARWAAATGGNSWSLSGNAIGVNDFIGSTNSADFVIKSNNTERWRFGTGGNIYANGASSLLNTSQNSIFIGNGAGINVAGLYHTVFGGLGGGSNMSGTYNTVLGGNSVGDRMGGDYNTAIGGGAAGNYMVGNLNTAIGGSAAGYQMSGTGNLALGGNQAGSSMGGIYNIAIGTRAGYNMSTGQDNVYIGSYASGNASQNNQFSIGNVIYGSGMGTGGLTNGMVGIGTMTPTDKLTVAGTGSFQGFKLTSGASNGYVLTSDASGNARWAAATGGNSWSLSGNAIGVNDFIGTTNDRDIIFKRNNLQVGALSKSGNIIFGESAMRDNTTGTNNIVLGTGAMLRNTTGSSNIVIGANSYDAGYDGNPTTGSDNVGLGNGTMRWGSYNGAVAIGTRALGFSQGSMMTAIGYEAMTNGNYDAQGTGSTAVGYQALIGGGDYNSVLGASICAWNGSDCGDYNSAIGYAALNKSIGDANTALGTSSMFNNIVGSGNVAVGYQALYNSSGSDFQTAIGYQSMYQTFAGTSSTPNIAIGYKSLYGGSATISANTANDNIAIGYQSMFGTPGVASTGSGNVAIGNKALKSVTTGRSNTVAGYNAMSGVTSANENTAFGYNALGNITTSYSNSAFGFEALKNSNFPDNTAVGWGALRSVVSGRENTALGSQVLFKSPGAYNVGIGFQAMYNNQGGDGNVVIGHQAMMNGTFGSNNVVIGRGAGSTAGTNNSIYIGYLADTFSSGGTNELNIGNILYGSGLIGTGAGTIGIGTTALNTIAKLKIGGQIEITGGSPGAGKVLTSDANGLATWQSMSGTSVSSVFGRTGAVLSASGDYTAGQITNVAGGNIAATNVQAALNELDTEKEPSLTAGLSTQYYRGDKTWQTLNTAAVTESTNLYFTNARVAAALTGAISNTLTGNLTANSALISDAGGKIGISPTISSTELGYLDNATSNIQTQIDNKLNSGSLSGTANYVSKFSGLNSLTASQIFDNGTSVGIGTAAPGSYKLNVNGNTYVAGDLTLTGRLYVDTIVNRTVSNVTISGSLLPDSAAPLANRDIGSNTTRWNNLYLSGQITIAGGSPGANKVLVSDANGLATWTSTSSLISPFNGWSLSGNAIGTNDFIGSTNAQDVIMKRNNTEKLRLANTGVSINDTLVVGNALTLTGGSGGVSGIYGPSAGFLILGTGNATALTVNSSSFVGVGPLAPSKNFEVSAGTNLTFRLNSGNASIWDMYMDYSVNKNIYAGPVGGTGDFIFTGTSVGIGQVPTSGEKLVVAGTGSFQGIKILSGASNGFILTSDASGNARWAAAGGTTDWSLSGNAIGGSDFIGTTNNQDLIFKTNSGERLRIKTNDQNLYLTGNYIIGFGGGGQPTNTALGSGAMSSNINGTQNMAIGNGALKTNISGNGNTSIGYNALYNNTSHNNLAIGNSALFSNVSGQLNIAIGYNALYASTGTTYNLALGNSSLSSNTSGGSNTALGHNSLAGNTQGSFNVGIGQFALNGNTGGTNNVAIGYGAGMNGNGNMNVAIGNSALYGQAIFYGTGNTVLGHNALNNTFNGASNNVAIGYNAGTGAITGSNNILIGFATQVQNIAGSNQLNIGNWIYGSGGNIGIGASTPLERLDISGGSADGIRMRIQNTNSGGYSSIKFIDYNGVEQGSYGFGNPAIPDTNMRNRMYTYTSTNTNYVISNQSSGAIFIVTSTGSVGVGTVSPASRFEVVGTGTFQGLKILSGASNGFVLTSDASGNARWAAAAGGSSTGWSLSGNTVGSNDFFGSVNNQDLRFTRSGSRIGYLGDNGNIGWGYLALSSLTSGQSNVAMGWNVLNANTSGSDNVSIGGSSMFYNSTGSNNVAVGRSALNICPTCLDVTAVGASALMNNTVSENSAFGNSALYSNSTGSENTGLGRAAALTNTSGNGLTAVGRNSMYWGTSANYNTAVGASTLENNATGSYNNIIGYQAARLMGYSEKNTAIGYQALLGGSPVSQNNTGSENVAIGYQSMYGGLGGIASTGYKNVALGNQSLKNNTSGNSNVAVGYQALASNTTGSNTALGYQALASNNTGTSNIAIGYTTMINNVSGNWNLAIGDIALSSNITGNSNLAVGQQSLEKLNGGFQNAAVGKSALNRLVNGSNNTALGINAGEYLTGSANDNTLIGAFVASGLTTGSNNIVIGSAAAVPSPTGSNQLSIGNWIYGSGGSIGIGTSNPGQKLEVSGNVLATSYITSSDRNLKENIIPLSGALKNILSIRGYEFTWKADGRKDVGIIAQDVEMVYPDLVHTNPATGMKSVEYSNLIAPMIEAMREQQNMIETQQKEIDELKSTLKQIQSSLQN